MSPKWTLPDASRSPSFAIRSWPAPSATTMTACPALEPLAQRRQEPFEGERHLGDQAEFTWLSASVA